MFFRHTHSSTTNTPPEDKVGHLLFYLPYDLSSLNQILVAPNKPQLTGDQEEELPMDTHTWILSTQTEPAAQHEAIPAERPGRLFTQGLYLISTPPQQTFALPNHSYTCQKTRYAGSP